MIDDDLLQNLPTEKQIEIIENMARKDLSFQEKCDVIAMLKPLLSTEAKKRQKAGAKLSPGQEKFKVRDELARTVGVSNGQLDKIIDIQEQAQKNPKQFGDIPQRIDDGMSVDYAYKMINTQKRAETPTPDLPKDKYELIEMDPPWKYDLPLQGSPEYKTMSLDEMKTEIPKLPAYKDCILFMWATNPKLDHAIDLMRFWGFTYKSNYVWGKYKDGKVQTTTGYYGLGAHELLLIGVKGSPGVPPEHIRRPTLQLEPKGKHSEKPDLFYRIIEEYYPAKKKLSMFSRKKRKGWTTWGDEVNIN